MPDDDFFFRTTLADTAQGPVLARVTGDRGFENVGLIYHDDPYGQGLAETFAGAWNGTLRAVPVGDDQPTYRAELRRSAAAEWEESFVGGRPVMPSRYESTGRPA